VGKIAIYVRRLLKVSKYISFIGDPDLISRLKLVFDSICYMTTYSGLVCIHRRWLSLRALEYFSTYKIFMYMGVGLVQRKRM